MHPVAILRDYYVGFSAFGVDNTGVLMRLH